jgi:hypothetical protein
MIAKVMTEPAAAPSPCTNRQKARTVREGAQAQPTAAKANNTQPNKSVGRRPIRSESGPKASWPLAKPTINRLKIETVSAGRTPRDTPITGSDAKHESIESDGKATLAANKKMNDFECGRIRNRGCFTVTSRI